MRWKWFLRPGRVVVDLTGQVVPDGDGSGRYRRRTVENVVPDGRVTSRCDGAVVYEIAEQRRAARGDPGTERHRPKPPGEGDRGRR